MREVIAQPGYTANQVEEILMTGQFVYADCFTVIPKIGSPLHYTNYQNAVSVVPYGEITRVTYGARKVLIRGLRMKASIGIEVDEQTLELNYDGELLYQAALSWPQALLQGRLDGARIQRDRYVAQAPGMPWVGGFPMFIGLVSTLDSVGGQSATIKVSSNLVLLDEQMPRDLWKPNCKNVWGDAHCGIIQAEWAVLGTIGPSPTRSTIPWAQASSEYALGKIHITNQDSVTRVRTVSRADATNLYLAYPLDFDPVEGLEFTAYPGDNRTMARCEYFHGELWRERFKGFPFVPVAETAI